MPDPTALRIGPLAFEALMDEARHCACDQHGIPLCVQCECLFTLAVAATDFAYAVVVQRHARAQRMASRGRGQEERHA